MWGPRGQSPHSGPREDIAPFFFPPSTLTFFCPIPSTGLFGLPGGTNFFRGGKILFPPRKALGGNLGGAPFSRKTRANKGDFPRQQFWAFFPSNGEGGGIFWGEQQHERAIFSATMNHRGESLAAHQRQYISRAANNRRRTKRRPPPGGSTLFRPRAELRATNILRRA